MNLRPSASTVRANSLSSNAIPVTFSAPVGRQLMDNELSHTLKRLRQRRGWTTRQMAGFSGLSHKTITDMERGVNVSVNTLTKALDALNYQLHLAPRETQEGSCK